MTTPSAKGIAPPSETASTAPKPQREGEPEETQAENVGTTKAEPKFGGLTAREAGLRSAQARRDRASAQEADAAALSSGKVVIVRTPVEVGHIIARLQTDAKKGNTQAARELREWLRQYPAEDETDISALDRRTRQEVLARVLADIERDEGAVPDGPMRDDG